MQCREEIECHIEEASCKYSRRCGRGPAKQFRCQADYIATAFLAASKLLKFWLSSVESD